MKPPWRDDAGSGSLLGLGIACVVVTVAGGGMTVVGASAAQARAAAAADLAALAAADAAVGRVAGVPCDAAGHVAEANGATLAACEQEGTVVTVTTATPFLAWHATASARAGPREPP
ncbi:Rv3654c family TadE-like protein [Leifsonia sp. NPDC077715]|uniref:Rv3654c family TadE-like protein n=1 Tax=Leifsonia sp. NPDC077715 TaxID=3155539 RepID=UPI0034122059